MLKISFLLHFLIISSCLSNAQQMHDAEIATESTAPLTVTDLDAQPLISLHENLDSGNYMPLKWAENSSVACFPGTRFYEFKGKHKLYRVQMPAGSQIKITVTPKDSKHRINLYALRLGANNYEAPPEIYRAISCESSYPIYAGMPNKRAPAKAQSVEYVSIRKPYNILIGVAGAEGISEGEYDLEIEIKKR